METKDIYITGTGQELVGIHSEDDCRGYTCVIHNPSQHHMIDWPTHWRDDRQIMERICPHGVGHPDPDDLAYHMRSGRIDAGMHGCEGCCVRVVFDDSSAV